MSSAQPYSEWIWSPEHGRYYCYRYNDAGQAEYMWSDASAQDQKGRGARGPAAPAPDFFSSNNAYDDGSARSGGGGGGSHRPSRQDRDVRSYGSGGGVQRREPASSQERLRRGSAEDVRRFHDGDEVSMAIEDRGQLMRASFLVRRGKLDSQGHWEYQLWSENGTLFDGGQWFRETELT